MNGLPSLARQQHWALLGRERRAVRVLVVDRLVAGLALELGHGVVAVGRQRCRVGEADEAVVVDHPNRLGDTVEDRLQKQLRLDVPAGELGRGESSIA
jgi:hypothetical protein